MLESGRYLIVNADDFNLTEGVNRGIIKSHEDGFVTSTTVLVNFPCGDDWVKFLCARKDLGVGLHLNVIRGKPISSPGRVGSLLDKDGNFKWRKEPLKPPYPCSEIREEFSAQIKRFEKIFSRKPTHLDTHYHIHAEKQIFEILLEVARLHRLPFRLSPFVTEDIRREFREKGVNFTDRFFSNTTRSFYWKEEELIKVIEGLPRGVSELMVHPGYNDVELGRLSSLNKQRESELELLCFDSLRSVINRRKIRLINYANLSGD